MISWIMFARHLVGRNIIDIVPRTFRKTLVELTKDSQPEIFSRTHAIFLILFPCMGFSCVLVSAACFKLHLPIEFTKMYKQYI